MEDLVPLLLVVLLLVLVLGVVTFVARVQPAKVLVAASARNCARAGIESLAEGRGMPQARVTAIETAKAGTAINPDGLEVEAYAEDRWGRGRVFVCETTYRVKVSDAPLISWFWGKDHVTLRGRASLTIEPYKSRWEDPAPGW
jgi:hypothetical protein